MSGRRVIRRARAKINLTLHVTGQRTDGYHLLDSLVCFADVADLITATPADELSLKVGGPLAAGVPVDASNLVMKAAALFSTEQGAQITISKYLPNAAGIGGGSADAAATLRALSELWGVPIPEGALSLGADVPVCLAPRALRMRGVGEILDPVDPFPEVWAVLVNPRVRVSTPPVFQALKKKDNTPMSVGIPVFANATELAEWCAARRNDLQSPALGEVPVIAEVLAALAPSLLARMSGSGATCFGICESQKAALSLAADIMKSQPGWWVRKVRLS